MSDRADLKFAPLPFPNIWGGLLILALDLAPEISRNQSKIRSNLAQI
jgi:hypothetical protein